MSTIVAQIAPQRSTQYADLATVLAPQELRLSALGQEGSDIRPLVLGGQAYLQFDLPAEPDETQARELGLLAMTSSFFVYHERIGDVQGPFLRPIETQIEFALPKELVMTRRYRGKTNEMFTHLMCNIARASSPLASRPWDTLRVFDPLSGGGTTLFTALVLGASVAGVDHDAKDIESTVSFLQQFMREKGIACTSKRERLKGLGIRWLLNIGKARSQQCLIAHGDTVDSSGLVSGFRPHFIVADLPYGIQHRGALAELLTNALPVWTSLLPPSGAMVLAWESRRLPRTEMIALIQSASELIVLNDPPYDALAHRVDRVIKQRDIVVARPRATGEN